PGVEVEELLLEILRGQGAPVDRPRDRAECRGDVVGIGLLRDLPSLRLDLGRQRRVGRVRLVAVRTGRGGVGVHQRAPSTKRKRRAPLGSAPNQRAGAAARGRHGCWPPHPGYRATASRCTGSVPAVAGASGSSCASRSGRACCTWSRVAVSGRAASRSGRRRSTVSSVMLLSCPIRDATNCCFSTPSLLT